MSQRNFDYIFFDVGGTLLHVDWSRVASLLGAPELAAKLEASEKEARRFAEARAAQRAPFTFLDYFLACIEAAGLPTPGDTQREALSEAHLRENLWRRIDPEAAPVLQKLIALGYPLAVISNSEGKVRWLLEQMGLLSFFGFVLDSFEEGVSKPNPEIFLRACARAKVSPERALYIGDFFSIDALGAHSAGMQAALLDLYGMYRGLPTWVNRLGSLSEVLLLAGQELPRL